MWTVLLSWRQSAECHCGSSENSNAPINIHILLFLLRSNREERAGSSSLPCYQTHTNTYAHRHTHTPQSRWDVINWVYLWVNVATHTVLHDNQHPGWMRVQIHTCLCVWSSTKPLWLCNCMWHCFRHLPESKDDNNHCRGNDGKPLICMSVVENAAAWVKCHTQVQSASPFLSRSPFSRLNWNHSLIDRFCWEISKTT